MSERNDTIIQHPPIIIYRDDLDRLRAYGIMHQLGDSAAALRHLLDRVDAK